MIRQLEKKGYQHGIGID
jgi:Ca2+-binding EF-hand superfamily protein